MAYSKNTDITTANELKENIKELLLNNFKLELSIEKTKITNVLTSSAKFLGYSIFKSSQQNCNFIETEFLKEPYNEIAMSLINQQLIMKESLKDSKRKE